VPVESRDAGAPPPTWFVDDLMRFHGQPYYVGLLSAAALHGAAHQQPQEFQIVTSEQLRPAVAGRARLRFFRKRAIERTASMDLKTETGMLRVSTPEATALDLMRYLEASGHLGNVATVLAELVEKIDGQRLADVARAEDSVATAQRLGYLFEQVGGGAVGVQLAEWIGSLRPRFVPLRRDRPTRRSAKDARWRVIVNEQVEADTQLAEPDRTPRDREDRR
jgi:predicted transcriptional regulator of viral defense system